MAAFYAVEPMIESGPDKFSTILEDVARQLVAIEHDVSGAFIKTPLLYPSGATVVVRIQKGEGRYFVSDFGLGHQEADQYGAGLYYTRHAKPIAEKAGVGFDNQAFFIMEASRDQLAGAVVTIGNCSQEATMRAADALAEKTFEDKRDRLYDRLVAVFAKEIGRTTKVVSKNVKVLGHSNTEWPIATIVKLPHHGSPTIFEPVTNHHNSVATATMKFHDIALLGKAAPGRVAVIGKKREYGTFIGVLSQAASVVEEDVSDAAILRLAKAA